MATFKRNEKKEKVVFDIDIEDGVQYRWYVPRVTSADTMTAAQARADFASDVSNRDNIASSVLVMSIVKRMEPVGSTPPFLDFIQKHSVEWDTDSMLAEAVRLATENLVTLKAENQQIVRSDEPQSSAGQYGQQ